VGDVGENLRTHLRWPTPLALLGKHLPVQEELTSPDAPRLAPCDGSLEARLPHRALEAELLRRVDVVDLLREEQVNHGPGAVAAPGDRLPGRLLENFAGPRLEGV